MDEPFSVSLDFGYDEAGHRTSVKDSLGGLESSVYGADGRLQTRIVKQGSTVLRIDFEYTSTGEILRRYSDEAGTTLVAKTTYAYNAQGQLQKIESKDGSGSVIDSFQYTWSDGQLASRIDTQPGIDSGSPRTTNYSSRGQE